MLSPDAATSEDPKSQPAKVTPSRTSKNPRTTTNGTSTYVSPYRQTPRSGSSPAVNSRATPSAVNSRTAPSAPAHAAKFKDIVNRFNETQDEKIPCPTNPTAASRVSPAVKNRKQPETKKAPPPWRPGGGSTKSTSKDTPKLRQNRSTSALSSHESKTTSRASSRASTISTTGEVKIKRPSTARPVEKGKNVSRREHDNVVLDGEFIVQGNEKRHGRSRSNIENDRPNLTLQTERSALRHRRSRSNVEVSSSPSKQQNLAIPTLATEIHPSIRSNVTSSSIDSPLSPASPLSKVPLIQRKHNTKTISTSSRNPLSKTTSTGRSGFTGSESTNKRSTLSSLNVSPHSSRHIPQPSKSPTLRAYITAPPPKKSPELRSSRPRAQISSPAATPKPKTTRSTGSTATSTGQGKVDDSPRTTARTKKKIPELGSIDFAARRAAIQAAYTKTLSESSVKENQPKVVVKQSSVVSLKGAIEEEEEEEEGVGSPSSHSIKEAITPIQETIEEEQEDDGDLSVRPGPQINVLPVTEIMGQDYHQEGVSQNKSNSEEAPGNNVQSLPYNSHLISEPSSSSVTPIDIQLPDEPLPAYREAAPGSFSSAINHNNEKRVLTEGFSHPGSNDDDESVDMAQNVEMVERPASKRFSLSGLPSLRFQIDNLPTAKNKLPGEESPLSPFTRSLLTIGEPMKKSTHVPVIITPDSPVESRRPPPRMTDISEYLRPDSIATEWTDVTCGDESEYEQRQDIPRTTSSALQTELRGFTVGGVIYPPEARDSLDTPIIPSPVDSELYTPTEGENTILSFIDRYDEPREDFLSPYIDSPSSEYAAGVGETDVGENQSGEDGNYEGDEDEVSSCSEETMHSSSRPSAEGSEDWQNEGPSASKRLSLTRSQSPVTSRQSINDEPLPPTPPPKDDLYLPPVPRKNSVPFVELAFPRKPTTTMPMPNRTPLQNALSLPAIPTDNEPLGLAIRISSPYTIGLDTHGFESQGSSHRPNIPSLEHNYTAPAKTPFSPPSSSYSDPDGSRRSSTFTAPVASPRASEITLPSSLSASIRIPTIDSVSDQKNLTKRKNIMKELVDTEKAFFQDMTVTEEIYKGSANACSALTSEDVKVMFGNTDAIIQFSKAFQESLKAAVASVYVLKKPRSNLNSSSVSLANSMSGDENIRGSVVSELSFLSDDEKDRQTYVGEAFGEHLAKMEKVYGDYCKNHETAVIRLQKLEASQGVAIWLRECKAVAEDLTNAWSLESLLIKPVQRILKYPLMLHSLLEVTPLDHPDYTALVWAEKEVRMVADRINELKKRKDILEKIVRKRNDTDIRHGISKLISRRAEMLRQTMGASEAVVDPQYNKLVENFNMHYVQLQVVFRDIDGYIAKTNEFFEQLLEISGSVKEFEDVSQTRYPELESKWRLFDSAMRDMVKAALSEHTHRVKKHCVEPIEALLRLFDNPQRLMVKRNKKSVDFARYNAIKEKGTVPDKKTKELADAYVALNEALIDELPKLFILTKKLVIVSLDNFVELQSQWNQTFSGALITAMPDISIPVRPKDIVANFSADYSYNESAIKDLGICNGKTVTTLKAITSPSGLGHLALSPSSISLDDKDMLSHHYRPNTADPVRDQRERCTSFSSRSVSSLDNHRRHSDEMTVAAAMSAIATAMPGASHMAGHTARARASSSVYPTRVQTTPTSPSVLRSLSAHSPLAPRPPTSHPRPSSSAAFAPVPETTVTPDFSRTSSPSPQIFSGAFSSALPMSDSEPSPGPSRSNSRQSNRTRGSESRRRPMTVAQDSAPLFVAVSLYEFNIDKQRREAGFPYLTYVQGEVFDVIGIKGEIWLAKNQDDEHGEIGWIWCKHFQRLP